MPTPVESPSLIFTIFTFILSEVPVTFVISDTALTPLVPVSVDLVQKERILILCFIDLVFII